MNTTTLADEQVPQRPPLRRALDTPVAGVCLGLSRHLGFSVPVVRVAFILLTIAAGIGLVLYCWLWIFVPTEKEPTPGAASRGLSGPAVTEEGLAGSEPRPQDDPGQGFSARVQRGLDALTSSPEVLIGGALLGLGALMLAQILGVDIDWRIVVVPAVILGGVILAWSQLDRTQPEGAHSDLSQRSAAVWQVSVGAVLVLAAILVVAGGLVGAGELITGIIVGAMLLAGLALVLAPWFIKLYRTSQVERARAAAEAERADIAAHLHDSVLQTLAMIQKQKSDPAAVERLARGQERQLRAWLYRQNAQASGTLKDQIMAVAAELEELHSVPVEVVTVGDSVRTRHEPLVAAPGRPSSMPSNMPGRRRCISSPLTGRMPYSSGTAEPVLRSLPSPRTGWGCANRSSAGCSGPVAAHVSAPLSGAPKFSFRCRLMPSPGPTERLRPPGPALQV